MRKARLLLALILILALFLRGLEVITGNYLFLFDHGHYFIEVRDRLLAGKIPLIGTATPVRGIFQGPGWYYLLTLVFLLGKGDPYYGMVLMLILSLASIIGAFLVARDLWGESAGLVTAYLFATAPISIKTTRHMWPPYSLLLVMVFYVFFLLRVSEKKRGYSFWLGLFTGLTFHFEFAFGAWLLPATILILLLYRHQLSLRALVLACLGLLIVFLPQIIFDFRHDFIQTRGVVNFITGKTQDMGPSKPFFSYISQHLFMFAGTLRESIALPEEIFSRWWLFLIFVTLLTVVFIKASKKERETIKVLVMILVSVFFMYAFYPHDLWEWYLIGLGTVYIFLLGFTLTKLLKHPYLKFLVLFFLLGISLYSLKDLKEKYYPRPKIDTNFAFVKAKKEIIDYIYNDADGKPFAFFVYTPPVYDFPYQYLFWWYGQKKYGYLPNKSKKGLFRNREKTSKASLFYLIIEPDPDRPWGAKGWLETVIKEGEVVWDKKFPSGLRLQKRKGVEAI